MSKSRSKGQVQDAMIRLRAIAEHLELMTVATSQEQGVFKEIAKTEQETQEDNMERRRVFTRMEAGTCQCSTFEHPIIEMKNKFKSLTSGEEDPTPQEENVMLCPYRTSVVWLPFVIHSFKKKKKESNAP
ncbi:hypothetical protein Y1Q_0008582 [Alligator mississippiensis]|uniref:Uncharacterized protein n=1 Tax=Alligator mississippiensis TaxID=8496 RepID=A0A151MSG4_ALLMI|nr:hypothetical protein Y1Q_0008582 [Alligator mississippiensis]